MEIDERTEGSAVVVSVKGRLDGLGAPVLEDRVSAIVTRGDSRVVLECGGMSYLSSVGLRALVICARTCLREGGALSVAAMQPDCRSVLGVSGLLSVIDYHATSEAALAAPRGAAPGGGQERQGTQADAALEIEARMEGLAVVVSLNGRLDGVGAPELEARVSEIVARGDCRVVLDCGGVSYLSSTGLRALVVCAKSCRRVGGTLAIAALQPDCLSLMEMSGFLSVIECHDTNEAALASMT